MKTCITVPLLMIAVFVLCGEGHAERMPKGSFLVKPAYSSAQLAAQLSTNATVASRYTAHFGIPAHALARYVQQELGLRRLPRSDSYRVFFVRPDGRIGSQVRRLRKGTLVFLHLRSGQPVLLGSCGNPLTAQLPGYAPPRVTTTPPRTSQPHTIPPGEIPLEPPVLTMAAEPVELPAPPALEPIVLSPWQAEPVFSPVVPELPVAPIVARVRPDLTPLLLAGLVGLLDIGGRPANPPPVIPEPAPAAPLAAAVALLIATGQRRRGRRH
ncbi:MAG: hypothetical protein RMM08_05400 [Armatimonadota bacterium]|nr:hypothetical protein [bacterium]MDW8320777.1 hypothetical protein [Armatimonadota bacterium]